MVAPFTYCIAQEGMPRSVPGRRICIHHHSHLPFRPDWIYGLLQRSRAKSEGTPSKLEPRGGGEVVQILQQGSSSSKLCAANICTQGLEMRWIRVSKGV